jgi:hypothetical protein
MEESIDIFIHDSNHLSEYEKDEYHTIQERISDSTILISDNAHANDELAKFARATSRSFLYFQEKPREHFYPGAGIGVAFTRSQDQNRMVRRQAVATGEVPMDLGEGVGPGDRRDS